MGVVSLNLSTSILYYPINHVISNQRCHRFLCAAQSTHVVQAEMSSMIYQKRSAPDGLYNADRKIETQQHFVVRFYAAGEPHIASMRFSQSSGLMSNSSNLQKNFADNSTGPRGSVDLSGLCGRPGRVLIAANDLKITESLRQTKENTWFEQSKY